MKLSEIGTNRRARDATAIPPLVERSNRTETDYPRDMTVPQVFLQRASSGLDAVAVMQGKVQFTYGELDRRSDRLAHLLIEQGVGQESVVAIMLDRSPAVVVAMLAAMKSGGAYLPLAPDLPVARTCNILRDSRAPVAIASRRTAAEWPRMRADCPDLRTVLFEDEIELNDCDSAQVDRSVPGGLAYVIYTSGTSGTPKGVMVEHRPILRLVLNTNYIRLGAADRILQTGALSFDAATFEIWGALLNGGSVYLPPQASLFDPSEIRRLVREYAITVLWLTAGLFNAIASEDLSVFAGLRAVLTGGERLSPHHVNLVRRTHPHLLMINGYGPTENTTFATTFEITEEWPADIPIGTPIANSTAYILDGDLQPVPIGTPGELYVGGDGLARGYLNDPVLTTARFVLNPFRPGERLYRTGDLARYREDAVIEYLGRVDDQLKVRGYRLEPGDIETALLRDSRLLQAVATARTTPSGEHQLVAYYRARTTVDASELRSRLRRELPDYMVPTLFVPVDHFPLTSHGKVDRAALPPPEPTCLDPATDNTPGTETEAALIDIWRHVLERDDIGPGSNFFDLGGHSLRAVKLTYMVRDRFGLLLPFTIMFEAPTLREMAMRIIDASTFGHDSIDSPVVALSNRMGAPCLFAFPPGTADALGYSGLAGRLHSHSFHAFNFVEHSERLRIYADLIVQADPAGPYVLFGYSGGGNLAFRTALELERRGKHVTDVIMLDSSRFLSSYRFPPEEAQRLALEFVGNDSVQPYLTQPVLKDKVIRMIELYHQALPSMPEDTATRAALHLVLGEDSSDEFQDGGRTICSKSAWRELTTSSFNTYQGSGDHAHMLHRPHLEANAALIATILGRVASGRRCDATRRT